MLPFFPLPHPLLLPHGRTFKMPVLKEKKKKHHQYSHIFFFSSPIFSSWGWRRQRGGADGGLYFTQAVAQTSWFPGGSLPANCWTAPSPSSGGSPTATDRALKTRRGVSEHATNGAQGTHRVQFATKGAAICRARGNNAGARKPRAAPPEMVFQTF